MTDSVSESSNGKPQKNESSNGLDVDIIRVRAEIEAEAEERRARDPDLVRLENEIERAWSDIAPPGATGDKRGWLLDRLERLSMLDADVAVGSRLGIRQIKLLIRKAIYWYVRYVTDSFNVFAGVLTRLLRQIDERLCDLEDAARLSANSAELLEAPEEPSPETAEIIARYATSGSVGPRFVLSCGEGTIVEAISHRSGSGNVYGVVRDPRRILAGTQRGLDLRSGDCIEHLKRLEDSGLAGIVFAGAVETMPLSTLWQLIGEAQRVLKPSGVIVVAVADPANRDTVEADIRAGRGIAPATWRYLLERAGFSARLVPAPGPRVEQLVVAKYSDVEV